MITLLIYTYTQNKVTVNHSASLSKSSTPSIRNIHLENGLERVRRCSQIVQNRHTLYRTTNNSEIKAKGANIKLPQLNSGHYLALIS